MKSILKEPTLTFKPTKQLIRPKLTTKSKEPETFLTPEDHDFIKSLDLNDVTWCFRECSHPTPNANSLTLQDLIQIWVQLKDEPNVYLHELLGESTLFLPQNPVIPRNADLEKRCKLLKTQQENREYKNMTKNVDSIRRTLPEDTVSYQIKEINRQLIGVLQFVVSVVIGFVFGFVGIEMMVGSLEAGFRLLLGIVCSLVIGTAELYFLAKKL